MKNLIEEIINDAFRDESNSERCYDLKFNLKDDVLTIDFSLDCRRYGVELRNDIRILDGKDITVNLCERFEGCGIENLIEDGIERRFDKNLMFGTLPYSDNEELMFKAIEYGRNNPDSKDDYNFIKNLI